MLNRRVLTEIQTDTLKGIGFEQSPADPCLLWRVKDAELGLPLMLRGINLMVASKRKEAIQDLKEMRASNNYIKDLGELNNYMGCRIQWQTSEQTLKLDLHVYLKTTVGRFNVHSTSAMPSCTTRLSTEVFPRLEEQ